MDVKFLSILQKNHTFSILHTHFYKTTTSVCLFYTLFYLNNTFSPYWNYKNAFLEFQLQNNYNNLIVSWVQPQKILSYPCLAYINGDYICIVFIFLLMLWTIYFQIKICRNISKHKANFERVPAGNRGRLVKIAHLKFGGNEPLRHSWYIFKTLGLCNCATSQLLKHGEIKVYGLQS